MESPKKIFKSREDRVLFGVCGGIGEYLNVDPNAIRLLWIIFMFAGGAGVVAYIVAYFIIPERPRARKTCENCGSVNREDALFCQTCGQNLEAET
jgi:phage shock protein C